MTKNWIRTLWPEVFISLGALGVIILPMNTIAANEKMPYGRQIVTSSLLDSVADIPQRGDATLQMADSISSSSLLPAFPKNTSTSSKVKISDYDHLFKEAAEKIGWDWTVLAAIAKVESGFRPSVSGGLMGIMGPTARRYGYSRAQIKNPKIAVEISVRCIQSLDKYFSDVSSEDRIFFILASYVSGSGHIGDAQKVTKHYGGNPLSWAEVKPFVLRMSEKKYYATKGVRHGRFNGKHTINYIKKILTHAQEYSNRVGAEEK